jgi:chemotaxis protein CheC
MDTAIGRELKILLKKGEDALLRRDYERASTYFRRVYTTDPGNITAITNLGYSYAKMGRFSHALKCFITALDIDPDNQVARKNMSLLMKPNREDRSSVTSSMRHGKSGEESFIRYLQWGNMQMEQRNFYAAIQYFREASRIHPDFIEPYLKIGMSYEELKEYAEAAAAFGDALDIFPKDPVAREHLDRCRGNAGEEKPVEKSYMSDRNDPEYSRSEEENRNVIPVHHPYPYLFTAPKIPSLEKEPEIGLHPADIRQDSSHPVVTSGTIEKPVNSLENISLPVQSEKSVAQQMDDEVIRSILNQYSDLINTGKNTSPKSMTSAPSKSDNEEDDTGILEGELPEESLSSPTDRVSMSSDDILSNILMKYQEDKIRTDSDQNDTSVKTEGTHVPYTGQATLNEGDKDMTNKQKEGIRVELNDVQKDALRELGNIGASHAATTLSTMLNTPIMLNVPEIGIIDFDEISRQLTHENSAMVVFTMEGQMAKAGYVVLHVPRESVVLMTSIMLGLPIDPTRDLNEMDESAINEIGNIMVSAFLDGTAELLGIIMLPSPPRTIFDFPKKVFDLIIQESNILYDNVVFFRTELICDEHELNLNIFMLPNPPVLQEIVRMLEQIIENSAQGR